MPDLPLSARSRRPLPAAPASLPLACSAEERFSPFASSSSSVYSSSLLTLPASVSDRAWPKKLAGDAGASQPPSLIAATAPTHRWTEGIGFASLYTSCMWRALPRSRVPEGEASGFGALPDADMTAQHSRGVC